MLQLFSSYTFEKRFAVWFCVTLISHGFLTYAFHDKIAPFFTLETIGGVTIFSLWMAYSFAAFTINNSKHITHTSNEVVVKDFNFYVRFFFTNVFIFSAILIFVLIVSYFILKIFTVTPIPFFMPVSKSVFVLLCLIFILTILKYFYHRLQHRLSSKRG